MNPNELLLMKNISKIYYMLNLSRSYIEKFYKEVEKDNHIRKVQIHGNASLDHLIESDNKYLISWRKSKKDFPIIDLVTFYKNDYQIIDIKSLYDEYNKKYQLNSIEKNLFFSLINLPWIIINKKTNYIDCININGLVDYVDKTIAFISKQNQKD